jgi:hypothetical protein
MAGLRGANLARRIAKISNGVIGSSGQCAALPQNLLQETQIYDPERALRKKYN